MTDLPSILTFNEIKIGQKITFEELISEKSVDTFAQISGDFNPLHMDDKYAALTNFGKRICHGMLLSSFFSRLVGMYLPGKNSLYFSQTLNFRSPCFIGDKITVEGIVLDKSESTKIVTISTKIFGKDKTCLIDGEAKVILREN